MRARWLGDSNDPNQKTQNSGLCVRVFDIFLRPNNKIF